MSVPKVVLATRNVGKIRELADSLRVFGLEVLGLNAFPEMEDVAETGASFEENSLLKACAVARYTGCIAVADDSGDKPNPPPSGKPGSPNPTSELFAVGAKSIFASAR